MSLRPRLRNLSLVGPHFPNFGSEGISAPEKSFGKIVFGIRYNLLFEFFNLAVYFLNVALQTNIVPTAILESADFSDGIQVSELAGSGSEVVFRFNGREVDAGRYHPALSSSELMVRGLFKMRTMSEEIILKMGLWGISMLILERSSSRI